MDYQMTSNTFNRTVQAGGFLVPLLNPNGLEL